MFARELIPRSPKLVAIATQLLVARLLAWAFHSARHVQNDTEEFSMETQRFTPAAIRVGTRDPIFRRSRRIVPLAVVLLAIFTASAQAHTVTASATCKSVRFDWSNFSAYGNGNGGLNTPGWAIVFKPAGGPTATSHGVASFAASVFSLTVAIPSGNGVVTASSSWSSAQTRDGNSNSGTDHLTIADCPAVVQPPAEPPPPPPAASPVAHPSAAAAVPVPAPVALSTMASAASDPGRSIRDRAVLSGGSSPTGTLTFSLYAASDSTCARALRSVSVVVSGAGSYVSPPVAPGAGSYQWVASYSGDNQNNRVSAACNDPAERATVAPPVCPTAQVAVRGVTETVRNSVSAHIPALGVKRVTFDLDGRKLVTLTKPSHQRFSVTVDTRKLGFGVHRLTAKVTMLSSSCGHAAVRAEFIHVKPTALPPRFAG
jgi:hypothetical protein